MTYYLYRIKNIDGAVFCSTFAPEGKEELILQKMEIGEGAELIYLYDELKEVIFR